MIPESPRAYRRDGRVLMALAMGPALIVAWMLLRGSFASAAVLFVLVFAWIGCGTILPRVRWFGPLVSELPPEQAGRDEVCLTIDDGPDAESTLPLLDVLDRHQAKAMFFLIGRKARAHPELVREIARRGHVIGNHSETHPSANFWRLRPERLWQEIAGCQETLREILGQAPRWFRPPVGHHNLFVSLALRTLGLTLMVWNCRGYDAVRKDVASILKAIDRGLHPGAIILLHDATPIAVPVLEGTLQLIKERGLRPALASETALVPRTVT